MAVKTFRLGNGAASGSNYGPLFEADQTAATLSSGWTLGKIATAFSAESVIGSKLTTTAFTAESGAPKPGIPASPSANGFRTDQLLNGTFDTTAWSFVIAFRSVSTAYSGTIRARIRVFRSFSVNGSVGVTELTAATQVGTTTAVGSTTADTTSTVTWTPAAGFTIAHEYLFVTLACEIVTASGSNTADALLRSGTSTIGTRITTGNYIPKFSLVKEHINRRRAHRLVAAGYDRW